MIVIAGYLTIAADQREAALAAVRPAVEATRAEAGNLDYAFSFDATDDTRLNVLERWEDDDALTAHMGSDHLAEMMTAIGPCIGGAVSLIRYDVSGSTTLI